MWVSRSVSAAGYVWLLLLLWLRCIPWHDCQWAMHRASTYVTSLCANAHLPPPSILRNARSARNAKLALRTLLTQLDAGAVARRGRRGGQADNPPLNFVLSENCRKCKKMWEIFCPKMQRLELRTSSWRNLGAKLKFWALSLLRRKCLVWVRRSHVCDLLTF